MSRHYLLLLALFPVLAVAAGDPSQPPPLCGIEQVPMPPPEKNRYIAQYMPLGPCDYRQKTLAPGEAVAGGDPNELVAIECFSSGSSVACEVWPQGEVSYVWTASSNVSVENPGPTGWAQQGLRCRSPSFGQSGWVEVTVTSKFGLSSQAYASFSCDPTDPH